MSKINIKFMSDEAFETLKVNIDKYYKLFIENPTDSSWINSIIEEPVFIVKKYQIEDFSLKLPKNLNDKSTDIENSIKLYEHLCHLPNYVLSDKRFWLWLMFEKLYELSLALMEKKDSTAFKHQWLSIDGNRRGLFFGIISRCYYRVALTKDESLSDKYELSKFAIENPRRFRELSWRAISNHPHVVKGMLKAEKQVLNDVEFEEKGFYYDEIAKDISKLGSIKLIDMMSEEDIYSFVYRKYVEKVKIEEERQKNEKYLEAIELLSTNEFKKVEKAKKIFASLKGYKNSNDYQDECDTLLSTLQSTKKTRGIFKFLLKENN